VQEDLRASRQTSYSIARAKAALPMICSYVLEMDHVPRLTVPTTQTHKINALETVWHLHRINALEVEVGLGKLIQPFIFLSQK
jgi:hypothetical protein